MIAEVIASAGAAAAAWLWDALSELALAVVAVLAVAWVEWAVRDGAEAAAA